MIYLDTETYSEVDLKVVGGYAYARHPSTEVLCACWLVDDAPPETAESWTPSAPPPQELFALVRAGHQIKCHNVAFDAEVWRFVLTRYGWWWPGYDAFLCSMAQAQITNLPGDLDKAASFFGFHKDKAGGDLMRYLCRPEKTTETEQDPKRHHTPEALARLMAYCHQDVRAERGFCRLLPPLSPTEERIWRDTWTLNRRGVYVDMPLLDRCEALAEQVQKKYRKKLQTVTGAAVPSENHRQKLALFIEDHGGKLPRTEKGNASLGKELAYLIDMSDADEYALQAFAIYKQLNKSSVSKFKKMRTCRCTDGRLRGMLCYSGAAQTGRDAGRLVQLQNPPRGVVEGPENYDFLRDLILSGCTADELEVYYGSAMEALASAIRPCLRAAPGCKLVAADYSAIEGRVLAWGAGETKVLQAYAAGLRVYAVAAADVFGCSYEQVVAEKAAGDSSKDKVGKVCELACGYQGSYKAYMHMGGVQLGLTINRMKEIVAAWREGREATASFWAGALRAALEAVRHPMRRVRCRRIVFGYDGRDLRMQLPSGRCLWYRRARIGEKVWDDGGTSPQLEYYGLDDAGNVGWISTYGGKLVANWTQATARDIMMDGALRAERAGYPMIMRVHDELVAELPEEDPRTHEDLCALMREGPAWADGLPLDAAGWSGAYYRKD